MRIPELSNYECLPSRAGGSPFLVSHGTNEGAVAFMNGPGYYRPPPSIARGRSSVGRALRSQCRGRRFDPDRLHHIKQGVTRLRNLLFVEKLTSWTKFGTMRFMGARYGDN